MAGALDVVVRFIGDSTKAVGAAKEVESATSNLSRNVKRTGLAMSAAITVPFVAASKAAIDELKNAEKVGAQTNAVLKSTGGIANVSAKQVDNLAQSIADYSGMDDEAVKSGENMLLTFTRIRNEAGKGNDIFNQATAITADLSTAWGMDFAGAAVKVGKALNDPISGMTALSKVGVTFTDQQKEQIKTLTKSGDLLGAQKLILQELQTEVGGSAKAYGETLAGQVDRARESLLNAGASIVTIVAPALNLLASIVQEVAGFLQGLPAPVQTAVGAFALLVAGIGPMLTLIGNLKQLKPLLDGIGAMSGTIGTKFSQLGTALGALAPVAPMIGGIAIAAGVLTLGLVTLGNAVQGVDHFAVASEHAKKAATEWATAQITAASAGADTGKTLDTLRDKHDILGAKLKELQEAQDAVNQRLGGGRERYLELGIQIDGVKTKHDLLGAAISDLKQKQAEEKAANDAVRAALDAVAASTHGVTGATNEQITAVTALTNTYLAAQGGALGYEAATLNVESAQKRVDDLVAQGSIPTSIEYRQAVNQLEQAKIAAAGAAVKMQTDEQALANTLETKGVAGLIALRDTLIQAEAKHHDASGATQEQINKIQDLINKVNEADGKKATASVNVDVTSNWREFVENAPPWVRQNLPHFQTGGVVPGPIGQPMLAVVHGGEQITPAGESAGSGDSGPPLILHFEIVQHLAAGVSPAEVGARTVDAIRQYERVAGRAWRSG